MTLTTNVWDVLGGKTSYGIELGVRKSDEGMVIFVVLLGEACPMDQSCIPRGRRLTRLEERITMKPRLVIKLGETAW